MNRKNAWTAAEDALMREHYRSCSTAMMREMLPARSRKGINLRACVLGLTDTLRDWTPEQDAVLREHYRALGAAAVGQMIGRSVLAVRGRASVLGVKADKHRPMPQRAKKTRPEKATKVVILARKPRPAVAIKPSPMVGDPIITSDTRVTLCPHGVDRRYTVDHAPRVIDSADCRKWARLTA